MRIENKLGLVTAAASGMGRAGALRFAAEGASVMLADRDASALHAVAEAIEAAGGRAHTIAADLSNDDEARDIVRAAADALGGLDFVWNHVGTPGPARAEEVDWNDFALTMDLNLRSVAVTTAAALAHLRARGGGALLYTSSVSGLIGSRQSPAYSAAKHGVIGYVKAMAIRLAPDNIRVNALCPGPIDTPMLRVFVKLPDQQALAGMDPEALIEQRQARIPMQRPGRPEEVANAALFLLSDEASYITGVALPVDGGATAG